MCIISIAKTGFLLLLISGTVIISGCTDNAQSAQSATQAVVQTVSSGEEPDYEYELAFMKDVLSEMKNQGKNITSPLETYRMAKAYFRAKDPEGFENSLQLFYEQSNLIMVKIHNINTISTEIQINSTLESAD